MLTSGSVRAMVESRMFCVKLAEADMLSPMLVNVWPKLTELARVLCVYDRGLYMLSRFLRS